MYTNDWPEVSLAEIVSCQGGCAFSPSLQGRTQGASAFFKVSDMNRRENMWIMRQANNYVSPDDEARINGKKKPAGSVIFPKVGAAIFTNKKRFLAEPAFVDNNVMAVWSTDPRRCLPEFLFLHFLTISLSTLANPGPLPSISNSRIYDCTIHLPPLEVQKKITAILFRVREAVAVQQRLAESAYDLKRATLNELFSRGLRREAQKVTDIGPVPESWDVFPLSDHHSVGSGGTPSRSAPEYWTGGAIPWVKTTEVNYCVIRKTEEKITQVGLEKSAAKLLLPGTLLMAMYGQGVTRGKVAVLGIEAACNQACAWISPIDQRVDTQYLYHFLTYRYYAIRQLAHGGQQQNLNLDIVRALPIAVPRDRDTQRSVAAILDTIDSKSDIHLRKRDLLDELFRSLLHKLMAGEVRVSELDLSALPSPAEKSA